MRWLSFVLAKVLSSDCRFISYKNIILKGLPNLATYLQSLEGALPPASLLRGVCKASPLLIQHKLSYSEG